ncbi:hypothetical protein ES288_A07G185200v1 [Gossypium darwinii]|uniref:Secreted protein n=1 Tax=Gossypium darwinii TaxID=34276 RepID=A0A5D2FZG6_GOSDA|nr:hypothetical protein ES288_A07G185200v1 [Gossypium darwinii]
MHFLSITTAKIDFLAFVSLLTGFHFSPRCRHRQQHWKAGKNEHHLWKKRDSAGSTQKAFNLVRITKSNCIAKNDGSFFPREKKKQEEKGDNLAF